MCCLAGGFWNPQACSARSGRAENLSPMFFSQLLVKYQNIFVFKSWISVSTVKIYTFASRLPKQVQKGLCCRSITFELHCQFLFWSVSWLNPLGPIYQMPSWHCHEDFWILTNPLTLNPKKYRMGSTKGSKTVLHWSLFKIQSPQACLTVEGTARQDIEICRTASCLQLFLL